MKNLTVALLMTISVSYHTAALQTGNDLGPLNVFNTSNFVRFCVTPLSISVSREVNRPKVAAEYLRAALISRSAVLQALRPNYYLEDLEIILKDLEKKHTSETSMPMDIQLDLDGLLLKKIKVLREELKGNNGREAKSSPLSLKKLHLITHSFHYWALTEGKAGKFPYQLKMVDSTSSPDLDELLDTTNSASVMLAFISDSPKLVVICDSPMN